MNQLRVKVLYRRIQIIQPNNALNLLENSTVYAKILLLQIEKIRFSIKIKFHRELQICQAPTRIAKPKSCIQYVWIICA